jgi:probable HAF family extracellular repeat protein
MRRSRVLSCAALVLATFATGGPAAAGPRQAVDLGTLPGGDYSATSAINNRGVVAGISRTADGVDHPVRWSRNGKITQLSLPDGTTFAQTVDINESNTVVGYWQDRQLDLYPSSWDARGVRTDLPVLPGSTFNRPYDINDAGTIVGYASGSASGAVRWNTDGTITELPVLPGSRGGQAIAINNAGTIVGFNNVNEVIHAVRWTPDGTVTDLGGLGGSYSETIDVNERGAVAGQSQAADGSFHAVRWSVQGVITDLSPGDGRAAAINDRGVVVGTSGFDPVRWTGTTMTVLPVLAGDFQGFAVDVNRFGVVAGLSGDPFGPSRGVVWDAAGTATELAPPPGARVTSVNDLNDRGAIVGQGYTANGEVHAFRW